MAPRFRWWLAGMAGGDIFSEGRVMHTFWLLILDLGVRLTSVAVDHLPPPEGFEGVDLAELDHCLACRRVRREAKERAAAND